MVAGSVINSKGSMPHPQARVTAFFDITGRASKAKNEEVAQALLRSGQIVHGVQLAQNVVVSNLPVKGGDEPLKSLFANRGEYVLIVHNADSNMACRLLEAHCWIWRQLETTLRGAHSSLMRVVTEKGCRILNVCESEPEYLLLRRAFDGEPRLLLERRESGIAALNDLRNRRAFDLPDAVVIPWRLPMLTSREFIAEMKADGRLSVIPIIVLADVSGHEASDLRDAGAACVFSKGITLDSFEATAAALLRFCLGICAKVQVS